MCSALQIVSALLEDDLTRSDVLRLGVRPHIDWYRTERDPDDEDGEVTDEGSKDCVADETDLEDGVTSVDKAVDYLQDEGARQASASSFCAGLWYSPEPSQDWRDGKYIETSFYLKGFTGEEEHEIYTRLKGKP